MGARMADALALPITSPIHNSITFIDWQRRANEIRVETPQVVGVVLAITNFNLSDATVISALQDANLLEHGLTRDACSAVFRELDECGICTPRGTRLAATLGTVYVHVFYGSLSLATRRVP